MLKYTPAHLPRADADPRAAERKDAIPILVVGGFLGAGKTTCLTRALKDRRLSGTLVIVNEFGALGFDEALLAPYASRTLLLENGCLCCAWQADLPLLLSGLLEERDGARAGGATSFARIIIEPSGMADLGALLSTLLMAQGAMAGLRLAPTLVLFDACAGEDVLAREPLARAQLAFADIVALTKLDVCADADACAGALGARMASEAPLAEVIALPREDEDIATLLLSLMEGDGAHHGARARMRAVPAPAPQSALHGDIKTFVLRDARPIARVKLLQFLELLATAHGARLLRVKGFVLSAPNNAMVEVQGVCGVFSPLRDFAPVLAPAMKRETALVFIHHAELAPGIIMGFWRSFLGDNEIDAPDADALFENPLGTRHGGGLL